MRKIELEMLKAIEQRKDWRLNNTEVVILSDEILVYLHSNLIYREYLNQRVKVFDNCGWVTPTTKSRLNALGANVRIKNFEMVDASTLEGRGCWRVEY